MAQKSDYNFTVFNPNTYLITNTAGCYAFLSKGEFEAFIKGNPQAQTIPALERGFFYSERSREAFISDYATAIRKYRNYLFAGTGLHIFVLTSECNLNCLYCQASTSRHGNMMTNEIAEKCVNLALQSPSKYLSFEFQGGEPLKNFRTLKHIVIYTEEHKGIKEVTFNLVSNLTLLNQEMISFIKEHHICISTSLDGNDVLHNTNRPLLSSNSYALWLEKFEQLQDALDYKIGAIQTTTRYSLNFGKEIVDEYIKQGFETLFLRPLTPLGYAATRWKEIGYTAEEFIVFYNEVLRYIINKAINGVQIREGHAAIFLQKVIGHVAGNYTELRSPCGAGLGQLAYNYDGKIYTCDEGRMVAEMGDYTFQVGTIESKYKELVNGITCKSMAVASCLESLPQCADCVYAPYCGVCPILNYADHQSLFADVPNSYKCKIYKGILSILFSLLLENDNKTIKVLNTWAEIE